MKGSFDEEEQQRIMRVKKSTQTLAQVLLEKNKDNTRALSRTSHGSIGRKDKRAILTESQES
jgi:hypothetical protein